MLAQTDEGLFIPMSCDELTFMQFIDIKAAEQKFFKASQPKVELDEDGNEILIEEENEYLAELEQKQATFQHMVEICGLACQGPIDKVLLAMPEDNAVDLFAEKFTFGPGDEVSLIRIYCHLVNMIEAYQPRKIKSDFSFVWQGNEYCIDPNEAYNALTGISYTIGEAITALEFQRITHTLIDRKGDPEGNLAFTLGLKEFALLMRPKGHRLPVRKKDRTEYIGSQVKKFKYLPCSVVLDVRFFLLRTLMNLQKQRLTDTFLPPQKTKRSQSRHKDQRRQGRPGRNRRKPGR